jgi:hypothetical protein
MAVEGLAGVETAARAKPEKATKKAQEKKAARKR